MQWPMVWNGVNILCSFVLFLSITTVAMDKKEKHITISDVTENGVYTYTDCMPNLVMICESNKNSERYSDFIP